MARRYVSIKEVAARAGVSFQTASKVLNGGQVRVSPETAARIVAVAKQLGYHPNTLARSLVQRTTGTLGLVATDETDVAISQVSVAAEQAARRQGHAVLVGHLDPGGEDGPEIVRMLIQRRVDGVIAAAPQLEEDAEVAELLRAYVPAVSLHSVPGGGVPVVGSNHRETGRLATEHLLSLGHRAIGTVTGPFRRRVVRSRLHGYEDALRAAGIEPDEDLVVEADWTPRRAADVTSLLLQRQPDVTAIFVHNDTMAIGVLSALAAAGRRVPADVAVVGCDDVPFAEYLAPPLTTVRVPLAETGEQAVDLLLRRIRGEPAPAEPVRLPVRLVVRASCGAAGAGAGAAAARAVTQNAALEAP
ncbi:MAG: LacI family DNA-binding transcriptional regulator [Actinobacteria bacterium]|nr:LacI family DNA-binding transcriptional regulator [Actinomycetota bacterium]